MADKKLRLGILGAARNVPFTVLKPIQANPDLAARVHVTGVASMTQAEAEQFAKTWKLPKAYASFYALLADPEVDAVYNVLPWSVRCQWTIKALLAGKHVLSETPMTSNALEAMVAQRAAEDQRRVFLEGTHPTCHPVTKRVRQMILEGKIGALEHIDLDLPIGHSLEGDFAVCTKSGSLMSLGCHGIAIVRFLAGEEPLVVNAFAQRLKTDPEVDEKINCNLKFPSGAGAHIACSIASAGKENPTTFTISGSHGTIRVTEWFTGSTRGSNVIELQAFEESGERFVERIDNAPSRNTFYFQLMTFVDEVQNQERLKSVGLPWSYTKGKGPHDGVRSMAVIDAVYRAAGMKPRATTNVPPAPYNSIGLSKL